MGELNKNYTCQSAELYYYDFICDDNSTCLPKAAIDHIQSCENCLKKIDQLKAALHQPQNDAEAQKTEVRNKINHLLERHFSYIDKNVTCSDVKPFLPYLLDADLEIKIPTPLTAHLNSCAECHHDLDTIRSLNLNKNQLNIFAQLQSGDIDKVAVTSKLQNSDVPQQKIQQFINTASKIAARCESGIVTKCRIDKAAKTAPDDAFNLYAGFPIIVEQIENASQDQNDAAATIVFKRESAAKTKTASLVRLLKPAIVAAAAIVIVAGVFLSTPAVKAVSVDQVYSAMEKVKNIYIANFAPDNQEPKQQFWISRQRNVYITKTRRKIVFYDLDNNQKKTKLPNSNEIENMQLTKKLASSIKPGMYSLFGLLPFASISDIPVDAKWNRVTDEMLKKTDGVEIYDLIWTDKGPMGDTRYWKYKFYVDIKTYLPFKIEQFQKLITEKEYTFVNLRLVKYPDSKEFEAVVKGNGF